MSGEEKWITWMRRSHSSSDSIKTITRLESERRPHSRFSEFREATAEEILEEQQRRRDKETERAKQEAFEARPEYTHAKAINRRLEWMTPYDHPLDALTLKEWKALRLKLCGDK